MVIKRCIIVKDSVEEVQQLKEHLSGVPFFEIGRVCTSYAEAVRFLSEENFDLLFLDIDLPNGLGLQLLNSHLKLPPTIVESFSMEHAIKTYEIGGVVDYLFKPFSYERLLTAVGRGLSVKVSMQGMSPEEYFFVRAGRKIQRFDFDQIDYIEAYGIYSKITYCDHLFVVNENISTLVKKLERQPRFMRVHKSYIINMSRVTSFDHQQIWLKGMSVPIGVSYKPRLDNFMKFFIN